MDQDLSHLEHSPEVESTALSLNMPAAGRQVFMHRAARTLSLTYSTMVRNMVLPVSLTLHERKCISGSLLNLDVLMCRVLLAMNIAQMATYNANQVRFRLF